MSRAYLLLALGAVFCLTLISLSQAEETDHFHTFSNPSNHITDEDEHGSHDEELAPVTVLGVPLPEWLAQALSQVVDMPRLPKSLVPPPADAPTSSRAPLHRPLSASAMAKTRKRDNKPVHAAAAPGEWLVMVKKEYRNDFLSVLEDMGSHLQSRFGMREWLDVPALRNARRVHEEARKRGDGPTKPWRVKVRDDTLGLQALEYDKRMLVTLTIAQHLLEREDEVIDSLLDKEWTEFVEPNMIVRASAIQTVALTTSPYPWGVDRIDQRDLPLNEEYKYPAPTQNVRIYVVDTGIRTTHTQFGSRATFGYNAIDAINTDCNGHGTHVAGIAVGSTVGVARDVDVIGVKVLDCNGDGTASTVINGIDYAISDCPSNTKCIVSLSLGGDGTNSAIDSMIQSAYNNGLLAVSAAGNSAVDACNVSPARSRFGITVAATADDDERAVFSNYGTCVSIFAPGVSIPSASNTSNTAYMILSGTSQATPHVSGAAALFWGATNNKSSVAEVMGAMYASASLNKVTNTGTGTPNRMLYSLIDLGDVPQTPSAACTGDNCQFRNGSLTAGQTQTTPSEQFTLDSATSRYGYFQAWLTADADFDLELQRYTGATWIAIATSSGSSGIEWIQFATSATGSGYYRWAVKAGVGESGSYSLAYQLPNSAQAGSVKNSGAALAPFWLPFYRALF